MVVLLHEFVDTLKHDVSWASWDFVVEGADLAAGRPCSRVFDSLCPGTHTC